MSDLIITGIIFIVAMVLFILWQPTRLLLREIFFNPLKDSVFAVTDKKTKVKYDNNPEGRGSVIKAKA